MLRSWASETVRVERWAGGSIWVSVCRWKYGTHHFLSIIHSPTSPCRCSWQRWLEQECYDGTTSSPITLNYRYRTTDLTVYPFTASVSIAVCRTTHTAGHGPNNAYFCSLTVMRSLIYLAVTKSHEPEMKRKLVLTETLRVRYAGDFGLHAGQLVVISDGFKYWSYRTLFATLTWPAQANQRSSPCVPPSDRHRFYSESSIDEPLSAERGTHHQSSRISLSIISKYTTADWTNIQWVFWRTIRITLHVV